MKVAYVEDAEQKAVSDVIVQVIEESQGLIDEQTRSHIEFEGMNPEANYSFSRGGYVGTYQHTGERDVEVRLEVVALGPQRLFWRSVWGALLVAIGYFILLPSDNDVWILGAVALSLLLLTTGLLYVGTFRESRLLELRLYGRVVERLRAEGFSVLTDDQMEERDLEARIEGELAERERRERRKAAAK
ncbi:MAG TPA: hypothetical protein VNZ52_05915 [Candidatus Thermoplasmatota archaeon]|nr:hypothetical protein [Candidatus Thermoplasmatota archaeon]